MQFAGAVLQGVAPTMRQVGAIKSLTNAQRDYACQQK
jgi:hypothetical protein